LTILIRCDGSVQLGMGHVIRCLALAGELKDNFKQHVEFAMRDYSLGVDKVKNFFPVHTMEQDYKNSEYLTWLMQCISQSNSDILILDVRDGLSRNDLRVIKERSKVKIVTIDDPEEKRLESDLAFYPPVPQLKNIDWSEYEGNLFIGWEYAILRNDFSQNYPKNNGPIANILVSMGGTDEKNLTKIVIEAFELVEDSFCATILLGPGYEYTNDLKQKLESVKYSYNVVEDSNQVAKIMSQCHLAIISYGQTAFELAAMEVPAIYICLTDDHHDSSQLFVDAGIGYSLGNYIEVNAQKLADAIVNISSGKDGLKKMSLRASYLNISKLNELVSIILE
jgi:UDP-2,4-diacetamido-2,4,6-trideoxy-beta-L-altropyranose hydrolase